MNTDSLANGSRMTADDNKGLPRTAKWTQKEIRFFLGGTFYVDLKNGDDRNYIIDKILRSKGKIEQFLSKQVDYIIANKPESEHQKQFPCSPASVSVVSPKSSSFENSLSSPMSGFLLKTRNSRTSMILSKGMEVARNQSKGTSSLCEIARNWGIPVVDREFVIRAIKFYERNVSISQKVAEERKENSYHRGKHKFKDLFVKVEDVKCCYRPFFKVFKRWPDIEINNETASHKPKRSKPGIREPLATVNRKMLFPDSTKSQMPKNSSIFTPREIKKIVDYCDICKTRYTDLKKHLATPVHRSFMLDAKNYAQVIEIMNSFARESRANPTTARSFDWGFKKSRSTAATTSRNLSFPSTSAIVRRLDGSVKAKHFLPAHKWPITTSTSRSNAKDTNDAEAKEKYCDQRGGSGGMHPFGSCDDGKVSDRNLEGRKNSLNDRLEESVERFSTDTSDSDTINKSIDMILATYLILDDESAYRDGEDSNQREDLVPGSCETMDCGLLSFFERENGVRGEERKDAECKEV